jgi:DNA repair protein RadC
LDGRTRNGLNERVTVKQECDSAGHRAGCGSGCSKLVRVASRIYELIEYLLALTIRRIDTKPLAKRLIHDFGGIGPL